MPHSSISDCADDRPLQLDAVGEHPTRVLFADDEIAVRDYFARVLDRIGYDVLCALDGREAIEAWPVGGEPFDLVILDLNMPRVDGFSAYKTLIERHPGARFLFISGYFHEQESSELLDCGVPRLCKPFGPKEFADAVAAAL